MEERREEKQRKKEKKNGVEDKVRIVGKVKEERAFMMMLLGGRGR